MLAVRQRFEKALFPARARLARRRVLAGWKAKLNGRYLYELPVPHHRRPARARRRRCATRASGFDPADILAPRPGLPRFCGGLAGYFGYDTVRHIEPRLAGRAPTGPGGLDDVPDMLLLLTDELAVIDNLSGRIYLIVYADPATANAYWTAHERLQELHEGLGIRFPIYLLVTKADLLAGFTDYFATLDKDQRATPWGATFPVKANSAQNLQRFGQEFDTLVSVSRTASSTAAAGA